LDLAEPRVTDRSYLTPVHGERGVTDKGDEQNERSRHYQGTNAGATSKSQEVLHSVPPNRLGERTERVGASRGTNRRSARGCRGRPGKLERWSSRLGHRLGDAVVRSNQRDRPVVGAGTEDEAIADEVGALARRDIRDARVRVTLAVSPDPDVERLVVAE